MYVSSSPSFVCSPTFVIVKIKDYCSEVLTPLGVTKASLGDHKPFWILKIKKNTYCRSLYRHLIHFCVEDIVIFKVQIIKTKI